jgi:DNA segregation ATPase FtsK/SpoIIIE, S-DNA-T family
VKGAQVVNLAKDLARSLSAGEHSRGGDHPGQERRWRWSCPMPKRQTIRLSEILGSQAYNDAVIAC